jgi:hypothetical protein
MAAKEARRYFILPVEVSKAGQIIPIDRKLPSHFIHCKGIHATVKGFIDTPTDIQHLGEISILLNSGQVHPLHYTVGYSREPLRKSNPYMEAGEELVPNYRISGFYEDTRIPDGTVGHFMPYTVNIYFDCKAKV